jgi:hypothetical protein
MTDAVQVGTELVPAIGMVEKLPSEHAAVIRGLFELAAFVADHPELPAPGVDAQFFAGLGDWEGRKAAVERVAAALGVDAVADATAGAHRARRSFGPVRAFSSAMTPAATAAQNAWLSYADSFALVAGSADAGGGVR